jgi:CIC family chloride channel protein
MILKLFIATILTGFISGFFIVFYSFLIEFFKTLFFMGDPMKTIAHLPTWYLYAIPTISIFIVNYIVSQDKNAREYGVSEIAQSIIENKMTISLKSLFLKIFASTLSLASGFNVGTEGPSASIGAMIAYHIHKLFSFPIILIKVMISIGASSGIAAIFVSPITGISFAVEIIAYQFIKKYIGYLILASLVAFAVSVNFLAPITFFHSTGKSLNYSHLLLALLFIPFITFFIYLYLFLKKKLLNMINLEIIHKFPKYRNFFFSLIGGGVIGTILIIEPHGAFSGHVLVEFLINNSSHISLVTIFVLLFLRIVGTTFSIYANAVGGLFIPLMSIGALVGYSYAELLNLFLPFHTQAFFFAAIGAAVFMGVIMKLPLTAVILALETTFDYNVVISTGIVVVIVNYLVELNFTINRQNITKAKA